MKKLIAVVILAVLTLSVYAATNGVMTIPAGTEGTVIKFTFATMTDLETVLFKLNGSALRIVVKSTTNDPNGYLCIKDISDANYVSLPETTFSASSTVPVNFSISQDANSFSGIPVAGYSTLTLTNCAALGATEIYLYVERK